MTRISSRDKINSNVLEHDAFSWHLVLRCAFRTVSNMIAAVVSRHFKSLENIQRSQVMRKSIVSTGCWNLYLFLVLDHWMLSRRRIDSSSLIKRTSNEPMNTRWWLILRRVTAWTRVLWSWKSNKNVSKLAFRLLTQLVRTSTSTKKRSIWFAQLFLMLVWWRRPWWICSHQIQMLNTIKSLKKQLRKYVWMADPHRSFNWDWEIHKRLPLSCWVEHWTSSGVSLQSNFQWM